MKIIGLCGGSGSGKTTIAGLFARRGIPTVDADAVYHDLISRKTTCLSALCDAFGDGILAEDGTLCRKKLAEMVFRDAEKRETLNRITHRYILEEVRRLAAGYEQQGYEAMLFDAPLLFESGFDKECFAVVCAVANRKLRMSRVMARDGISEDAAALRFAAQLPEEELIRRADVCIYNEGDLDFLAQEVEKIITMFQLRR